MSFSGRAPPKQFIEKLIKKKVYKTTFDKTFSSQKLSDSQTNQLKENNKNKQPYHLPPEENFLNFRESGKIPDFLNTK